MDVVDESGIIVPVPATEPIVGKWRSRYDPFAAHGVPAHITLIYPFKNPKKININDIAALKKFFTTVKQFSFTLVSVNTFPVVIYLEPEPKEPFITLTKGLINLFPDYPPFEGKFDQIRPHLTIGNELPALEPIRTDISRAVSPKLPLPTSATEAWLMESKSGEWTVREKFRFLL